jgi:hypothetical protein
MGCAYPTICPEPGRHRRSFPFTLLPPLPLERTLRSFTFGHVRQLDEVIEEELTRAWAMGLAPGDDPMVIDIDSTICEVAGYHKQGAAYGYTKKLGYHPLLAVRSDTGAVLHGLIPSFDPHSTTPSSTA